MEPPSLGCFALLLVILTMRMVRSVGVGENQSPSTRLPCWLVSAFRLLQAEGKDAGGSHVALRSSWVGEGKGEPPSGLPQLSPSQGVVTGPRFFQLLSN